MKTGVFVLLFVGFFLIFYGIWDKRRILHILQETKYSLDRKGRQRQLALRRQLSLSENSGSLGMGLMRMLAYTGLSLRFPGLTPEMFVMWNMVAVSGMSLLCLISVKVFALAVGVFFFTEYVILTLLRNANYKKVDRELIRFMEFMGNYSITTGELASIIGNVSRYMSEPLRTVLDMCYYEALTTGDVSQALLMMNDRIENEQFGMIVRNIEAGLRYSGDLKALVAADKRSVRDYLKSLSENKGLMLEAGINMILLMLMSLISLVLVNEMIEVNIWAILFQTIPGRVGVGIIVFILVKFLLDLGKNV
ncbi:MAG: hypothetical protein K6F84_07950 [Lachnospiraceae bacterium]|nr:hypothetical protein [Lachnospiraceae bacterium]